MRILRILGGALLILLGVLIFARVNGWLYFTMVDLLAWALVASAVMFILPGFIWRQDVPWLTSLFIPGSLAFALGAILLYTARAGTRSLVYSWLIFLIAPALALIAMYYVGPRLRALWWTGLILGGISLFLLALALAAWGPVTELRVAGAVLLIILGLGFAFSALVPRRSSMQLVRPED